MIDYDFEKILQEVEQSEQKKQDYDFKKILHESTQRDLDELRKKVENGSISAQDAQKEMTAIADLIPLDKLNFGASNFENGLIDSLVNIGASGEYILNLIKKVYNGDPDKQFEFFKNLSSERKEQLAENPSFIRSIAKEIIPSIVVGATFGGAPAIGSIGKNIASIPVLGKKLQSFLSPLGKLSDLSLQSGLAGALSGFEGEKYQNAIQDAVVGAGLSGAGSLASKGLEKLLPAKSPQAIANTLLKETNISRKEFDNLFKKAENKFSTLKSNLDQPLYEYDQTKKNVFKMLKDYNPKDLNFEKEINANTVDAVKNKIRKQLSAEQFPKEFGDFFNKLLKESAEPATRSNYLANQYYRNVNKISDESLQILMALGLKDAFERKN